MDVRAMKDQEARTIEVRRLDLLSTLKTNREKHIADFNEAMAGYREALLEKLEEGMTKARAELKKAYEREKKIATNLTEDQIKSRSDFVTLVSAIQVRMQVPRCYAREYDAAIDMVAWDVRETLELSTAEFTCFVRDQWDWRNEFDVVNASYSNSKKLSR